MMHDYNTLNQLINKIVTAPTIHEDGETEEIAAGKVPARAPEAWWW